MFSKAANFDSQDGESLIERKEQNRRLKLVTAAKEVLVGVAIVVVVVIVVIVAVVVVLVVVFVDVVCVVIIIAVPKMFTTPSQAFLLCEIKHQGAGETWEPCSTCCHYSAAWGEYLLSSV